MDCGTAVSVLLNININNYIVWYFLAAISRVTTLLNKWAINITQIKNKHAKKQITAKKELTANMANPGGDVFSWKMMGNLLDTKLKDKLAKKRAEN